MPEGASTLLFEHPSRSIRRRELRAFFVDLAGRLGRGSTAACLVTTDAQLRELNRRFRGQDYATDVLSFPAAEKNGALGEIAVSLDRAAEQAAARGHGVDAELRILLLHGLLHLVDGLDHETDGGQMARAERRWRKRLGLPAGLIERAPLSKGKS